MATVIAGLGTKRLPRQLPLFAPGLRHEQLWRRWFDSARGLVPLHAVQASQ